MTNKNKTNIYINTTKPKHIKIYTNLFISINQFPKTVTIIIIYKQK